MIKVWMLLITLHGGDNTTDTVIVDDLATKEECSRVSKVILAESYSSYYSRTTKCIEIIKRK